MKYLLPHYWENIMGDNKGLKFEDFVADLLKEKYEDFTWQRTKRTYDGKKDFETSRIGFIGETDKYWVECKNFKNNISLETLSPTLVMAVNEKTKGILFFSYSKINDAAVNYITQFIDTVGKSVVFFSDEELENEILNYDSLLKKYFPGFKKPSSWTEELNLKQLTYRIKFNRNIAYDYSKEWIDISHKGDQELQVNETFCIDLFIHNRSNYTKNIVVKFKPEEYQDNFSFLNNSIIKNNHSVNICIDGSSASFKRFVFRFEKYISITSLPKLYIYENDIQINELSSGQIKGNWIINATLVGSNYLEIIDSIKSSTSFINTGFAYCIYGESGSGKSRVLKEIKDVLVSNGYKIISEDGDYQNQHSTGLRLLRKIISELSGLPQKSPFNPTKITKFDDNNSSIIKLLYSDEYSLTDSLDEAVDILLDLIRNKQIALVIDNVQFYNEDFAILLGQILDRTFNENTPFIIITAFNLDFLLPQTKTFDLFEKIKKISLAKPNLCFYKKIEGFKAGQAEIFLEHCIPGINSQHPETLKLIIRKAGHLPLYLQQMLHLFYDKNIIQRRGDFFYITDINLFHIFVNELPDKIHELLKMRWEIIRLSRLGPAAKRIIKYIVLFQNLPWHLLNQLNIKNRDIRSLINLGVLEKTASNQIVFHHSQIHRFFSTYFFSKGIERNIAKNATILIDKYNLEKLYPAQSFLAKNALNPTDEKVLQFGSKCLLEERINQEYRVQFAKQLYSSLRFLSASSSKTLPILRTYTKICDDIKKYESFSEAQKFYNEIYERQFQNYKNYLEEGEDYYYFILRYVNSFLSIHDDNQAHKVLLNALDKIEEFQFSNEYQRKKAKSLLLNRLCVTYKSLNDPVNAEIVADESIVISTDIKDNSITIKNYIDKGYIYYKDNSKIDKLLVCWNTAWDIFNTQYNKSIENDRISAYYHKALVNLISKDRQGAIEYIEKGIALSEKEMDVFNKIKLLLAKSIIYYLEECKDKNELNIMVRETIDLCVRHQSLRSYWTSWHLLGKITSNDKEKIHSYLTALEQLRKIIITEKADILYQYFYVDLAMTLRWMKENSTKQIEEIIAQIINQENKKRVREILKMDDYHFDCFISNFTPTTPINNGYTNFPCP